MKLQGALAVRSGPSVRARPRGRKSLEDFRDEMLRLRLRHAVSDDATTNAQAKHCLRIARHFGLNHEIAQHSSFAPAGSFSAAKCRPAKTTDTRRAQSSLGGACDYATATMTRN